MMIKSRELNKSIMKNSLKLVSAAEDITDASAIAIAKKIK